VFQQRFVILLTLAWFSALVCCSQFWWTTLTRPEREQVSEVSLVAVLSTSGKSLQIVLSYKCIICAGSRVQCCWFVSEWRLKATDLKNNAEHFLLGTLTGSKLQGHTFSRGRVWFHTTISKIYSKSSAELRPSKIHFVLRGCKWTLQYSLNTVITKVRNPDVELYSPNTVERRTKLYRKHCPMSSSSQLNISSPLYVMLFFVLFFSSSVDP